MKTIKFRPLRRIKKTGKITVASYMQWRKVKTADYSQFKLIVNQEYKTFDKDELVYDHKGENLFWRHYNPEEIPLFENHNQKTWKTDYDMYCAKGLDVDGVPTCQSVIDGSDPNCVPWNVFEEGGVTQDSLNYLIKNLYSRGDTKSTQLTGFVSGDLTESGFMVPGTSTGAGVVFGYEYRKESLTLEPDDGFTSGDGAGQGGPTAGVSGEYSVTDLFTEFNLPLLEDAALAQELGLELAYRYSDYSVEGTEDKSTDTYKVALNWSVNDDLRFRASYQRAVRTGNVRELFAPNSIGLFNWADPCGTNPTLSAEQCARTGVTAAQYGSSSLISPAGQYNAIFGGNVDIKPEKSDTISLGMIVSPSFIDGLDVTFDHVT